MPRRPDVPKANVFITLGDGVDLGVNPEDTLVIEDAFVRMSLGKCTVKRIDFLKECLDRLKAHAVQS